MLTALLLATTACGGAADLEISAGDGGQASSSDTNGSGAEDGAAGELSEVPSDGDPTADGETSSESSGDEDYGASTSSSSSGDGVGTDSASDLDDAVVSHSNDGGQQTDDAYGGEQPVEQPDGSTAFGPQQGEREPAVITDVQPVVRESWPLQLAVIIAGELRDGCQDLAWEMTPDGTTYSISVWQVQQVTEMACTMAIVPFETQIELGTSESEDFTVIVNGVTY